MLERYAMKVARTVLRGGSGSNVTPLPDPVADHAYFSRLIRQVDRTLENNRQRAETINQAFT